VSRTPIKLEQIAALVVDDQEIMAELITVMLGRMGCRNVERTFDGETAWSMLQVKTYGLIISDLNMVPVSGLQLLLRVRQDPRLASTPFLMTTASLNTENAAAAQAAGVDTYLLKPFTPDLLRNKVEATLRVHESNTPSKQNRL
jgi:two-component system chemotaxis response regulator CheY